MHYSKWNGGPLACPHLLLVDELLAALNDAHKAALFLLQCVARSKMNGAR